MTLLVILALVFGGYFVWTKVSGYISGPADYSGSGTGSVVVEIPRNSNGQQMADILAKKDVVKSAEAFYQLALKDTRFQAIQAGFYKLKKQMSAEAAMKALVNKGNIVGAPGESRVTIPEGSRIKNITKIIAAKTKISAADVKKALADPDAIGLPAVAKGNPEGYLFPATYSVGAKTTAVQLLKQMVAKTLSVAKDLDIGTRARALGLNGEQVLTVASIIEYEATEVLGLPQGRARALQPPQGRDAAAARLDGLVRQRSRGRRVHDRGRAQLGLALQHVQGRGSAAGTDRLARREDDRGGAQPGGRSVALLRGGQPRDRRDGVLQHQGRARRRRQEARAVLPDRRRQDLLMRCAVLGSPIAHSLSPAMHRAAYAELGLDWTYEAVELEEDTLEAFLSALGDDVRGFSVTAPLKRRTAELVGEATEIVGRLGVANTIIVEDTGLRSDNTDVPGAIAALHERGVERATSARILGGGATAASMAYAVSIMGAERVEFVVREPSRASAAAQVAKSAGLEVTIHTVDEPLIDKLDLLISTVPGDVVGSRSHEFVESSRAVFDVVYDPWPTPLAKAAEQADVRVVSGLDLLAHQAALQVELMTGSQVSPQLLRRAALAELSTR